MNLQNIQAIVNSGQLNWKLLLYEELATDKDALPTLLGILNAERTEKEQLITDLNFQLSRAHIVIEHPELNKDNFVSAKIKEFYKEGRINHCYANMD